MPEIVSATFFSVSIRALALVVMVVGMTHQALMRMMTIMISLVIGLLVAVVLVSLVEMDLVTLVEMDKILVIVTVMMVVMIPTMEVMMKMILSRKLATKLLPCLMPTGYAAESVNLRSRRLVVSQLSI